MERKGRLVPRPAPRHSASMRPRRGTPWKEQDWTVLSQGSPTVLQCGHGGELRGKNYHQQQIVLDCHTASMRPRRGTPWKVNRSSHFSFSCIASCFNAATEGNSVESPRRPAGGAALLRASMRPRRGTPWKEIIHIRCYPHDPLLQCGHGGELRGKMLWGLIVHYLLAAALQCGHGGELRGKPSATVRCSQAEWCFNAATEGNSVESSELEGA